MKNLTKKEMYEAIISMMEGESVEVEVEEIVEFCQKEIAQLEKKAEKAKEKAAQKKAETDALMDVVENVLSEEDFMPIADIVVAIGDEEVTTHKVISRLSALIKDGRVEKQYITVKDEEDQKGRKVMGYKKVAVEA